MILKTSKVVLCPSIFYQKASIPNPLFYLKKRQIDKKDLFQRLFAQLSRVERFEMWSWNLCVHSRGARYSEVAGSVDFYKTLSKIYLPYLYFCPNELQGTFPEAFAAVPFLMNKPATSDPDTEQSLRLTVFSEIIEKLLQNSAFISVQINSTTAYKIKNIGN